MQTFQFREITDQGELEQFMKLRYRTYLNNEMRNFLSINDHHIDIDLYDLHSKHFGLFCGIQPAGYFRIVLHKNETYNAQVFSIGRNYQIFNTDCHSKAQLQKFGYPDFPFVSYYKIPEPVKYFYYSFSEEMKQKTTEAGKLMLFNGFLGYKKVRMIIECAAALFKSLFNDYHRSSLNCFARHEKFYQLYDFKTIYRGDEYKITPLEKQYSARVSCLMILSIKSQSLPEDLQRDVTNMADEFRNYQQINRKL